MSGFTPMLNLESPINLKYMFLDDGRKLEYPTNAQVEHGHFFRTRNPLSVRQQC